MRTSLIHCFFVASLLVASTVVSSVHPGTEVFYRNKAIPFHRRALNRFREWRQRQRPYRTPLEEPADEYMSASVGSIDSVFIGDSRDVILEARDTMLHYDNGLASKYYKDLLQIPTEATAFAMYLKDALIGYDENDLAILFFAFRVKGRYDLIAVIEPHLAERVRERVDNDINRIWPILGSNAS